MEIDTKEPKKEVNQREFTKVEEWDQVAFTLIHQELAPKGYKEIKSGSYRGSVEANIPFLSKKSVQKCQKITAQMVRTFRDRAKAHIEAKIKETESWLFKAEVDLNACWFWEFSKKAELKYTIAHFKGQIGKAGIIHEELNSISIK